MSNVTLKKKGCEIMKGKITHVIALFEVENGEHAAVLYGVEGSVDECFDYVMATVADGETKVKYGGKADKFMVQAAQIVINQLQKRQEKQKGE